MFKEANNLKELGFNFGSCKLYREKVFNSKNIEEIAEKVTSVEMLIKFCEKLFINNFSWREVLEDLMLFEKLNYITQLVITSARFSQQYSSLSHNSFVNLIELMCNNIKHS